MLTNDIEVKNIMVNIAKKINTSNFIVKRQFFAIYQCDIFTTYINKNCVIYTK
tara:strand:- start:440 stop:598 length:159 start_codon:yes stop_codon:yes gene_type:complete